jgi:ribosomal protein L37AE/L43A
LSNLGKAYAVLGFLKKEKIDYVYNGDQSVEFPCFYCGQKATMNTITTIWNCTNCNEKGNIVSLHQFLEQRPSTHIRKQKIYNPKRELAEITGKLRRASKKYNDNSFLKLIEKMETLIEYHQKKPS